MSLLFELKNISLTKPGDSVTCTASVQNGSLLPAYLKRITAEKNGV